jgi:hypothetical protein
VEASHADDGGVGFCVIKYRSLTASLGHDAGRIRARYFTLCVRFNFIDPHAINDSAIGKDVNKFPRPIAHERVILLLHGSLLVIGLSAGESGTVRGQIDAVPSRNEGNVSCRGARKEMRGASDECRQVGLRDDFLCGFASLGVAHTWHGKRECSRIDEPRVRRSKWGGAGGGWDGPGLATVGPLLEFIVGPRVEVKGVRVGC